MHGMTGWRHQKSWLQYIVYRFGAFGYRYLHLYETTPQLCLRRNVGMKMTKLMARQYPRLLYHVRKEHERTYCPDESY